MTASSQWKTRWVFLILAGSASLIELGPLVTLLSGGADLVALLMAGLAYQAGNALPHKLVFAPRLAPLVVAPVGAALVGFAAPGTVAWTVGICLLSWALQSARRAIADMSGDQLATTLEKRSARVVGFLLAGWLPAPVWLAATLVAIAAGMACSLQGPERAPATTSAERWSMIEWIMLVHQMHYFSYCYALPVLLAHSEVGGLPLLGFWFALGWITYLAAEALWNRFPPLPAFLAGHISLTVILASMTWFGSIPWLVVALWILSGLGGGTVYCLKILRRRLDHSADDIERAEDAGHLLGVACALLAAAGPGWSAQTLPAVGAAWAALAVVLMIVTARRAPTIGVRAEARRGEANAHHRN